MSMTIQLEDRTAKALLDRAAARGMTLEAYLNTVAELVPAEQVAASQTARDFDQALDELFAGDARKLPADSSTHTREDIYFDRD